MNSLEWFQEAVSSLNKREITALLLFVGKLLEIPKTKQKKGQQL